MNIVFYIIIIRFSLTTELTPHSLFDVLQVNSLGHQLQFKELTQIEQLYRQRVQGYIE